MRTFFVVSFLCVLGAGSLVASTEKKTEANVPLEITFTSEKFHSDPFNTVELNVHFTDPKGAQKTVPAFWAGSNVWKVRYSSPITGRHRWRSQCSDPSDKGLSGVAGSVHIAAYRGKNPLFKHGQLEVAGDRRHLRHADGTPFFWLGDTWWMGLCHRIEFPGEFKQLAADRKAKGFNLIQIVAGLYPDMPAFDPRGANETGFPWETNYTSIRPEYFNAADKRIQFLIDEGFTPCIVGMWGYYLPMMGEKRVKQHWRELIARYGSWSVIWCVAGEANLPWYQVKNFPYEDLEQVRGWTEIARYVRSADPFRRLLTIHPTGKGKQNARNAIGDSTLIDFDFLQTDHGEHEALAPTLRIISNAYKTEPPMPVINGEPCYEMLQGKIPARWPRTTFWLCMMSGAAGHTYGANGIWQCNRPGKPHGNSPTGTSYGDIPWNEAMLLPGSAQIGHGRRFLERFPWERCFPQPATVSWNGSPRASRWGNWIWFPEGDPRADAPCEPRFFRRTFDIEHGGKIRFATLQVTADDKAVVWFNGSKLGETMSYKSPGEYDVTKLLRRQGNVLAIEAQNIQQDVKANPASLMAVVEIHSQDDDLAQIIVSDEKWRTSRTSEKNWQKREFNDSLWTNAVITAPYGGGPWDRFKEEPATIEPFAIGIRDELKIVYAVSPRPLVVKSLRANRFYRIDEFNPVSGETRPAYRLRADSKGEINFPAPGHHHDSVLALELDSSVPNKRY